MRSLTIICILLCSSLSSFSQFWDPIAPVPNDFRSDHSFGFSLDGIGYLVSGFDTDEGYTDHFFSYDPDTDTWTQKNPFPGPARGFAIGDTYNGKAYFGFGSDNNETFDDLWVYDPVTDGWTQLETCPCEPRNHPAFVALNGFIYVGLGSSNTNMNDWWQYDIANDTWSEKADFPAAERHHPFQFGIGDYVYTGFGHGSGFISNQWYRYDPVFDTWAEMASIPSEGRVAGTQFAHNGFGYALSGDGNDHSFMNSGEFWQYDPNNNLWTQLPAHPGRSRWAPASFVIDDVVYFMNGLDRVSGYLGESYKFDLSTIYIPKLRLLKPDVANVEFNNSSDQICSNYGIGEIEINASLPFTEEVTFDISVDPASTAVEGVDFIIPNKNGVIPVGEQDVSLEIYILNNAIPSGDKSVILNLNSTEEIAVGQQEIIIPEVDFVFDFIPTDFEATIGAEDNSSTEFFGEGWADMSAHYLYMRSHLEDAGINGALITKLAINILDSSPGIYNDFTISLINTNTDEASDLYDNPNGFVEVFSQQVNPAEGLFEFELDNPFAYDGISNLGVRICFNNQNSSGIDEIATMSVNYDALYSLRTVSGNGECPVLFGTEKIEQSLPVLTISSDFEFELFNELDKTLSAGIQADQKLYFQDEDKVFLSIEAANNGVEDCIETTLTGNSNDFIADDINWLDRVSFIENESTNADYTVTSIFPVDAADWNDPNISALYTDEAVDQNSNPQWNLVDIMALEVNEFFAYVTFAYQGTGSYAVGVDGPLSTFDINDPDSYDAIKYFDVLGREVILDISQRRSNDVVSTYFKVYLKDGERVHSETIIF